MVQDKALIKGFMVNDVSKKGGRYVANWRVQKPVIDHEKCVACGLCISYCPEAAINRRGDNKPQIDYRFCKGCGVCGNECRVKAITMVREV
jgi:pyruvate ferredoxin oxidoreductase delta subunit